MTKEERELLLRDLSARLQYGVKTTIDDGKDFYYITGFNLGVTDSGELEHFVTVLGVISPIEITHIKPYLRPMSSMTEEEEIYYNTVYYTLNFYKKEDWLNEHHFDYRGLIPMGLALEALEGMYKTE